MWADILIIIGVLLAAAGAIGILGIALRSRSKPGRL
jgi:Flp pilus assembly protein CpaB